MDKEFTLTTLIGVDWQIKSVCRILNTNQLTQISDYDRLGHRCATVTVGLPANTYMIDTDGWNFILVPMKAHFNRFPSGKGLMVDIVDESKEIISLAMQGPVHPNTLLPTETAEGLVRAYGPAILTDC